ncbi:centrin-2-like [Drosophila tropicalis]|uniref:centrin-2-like n=1 Tax=Drosophila tropicalis TaxID=46794 RepID=UPI0035ABEFF7
MALGNWIDLNTFELDMEEPPFILTPQEIMKIKKTFEIYDFQQIGSIEVRKMRLAMLRLDIEPETDEIRALMEVFDKSNSGRVTLNTFLLFICAKMAEENLGYEFVGGLFELCSGKMSLDVGDEVLDEMMQETDFDGDLGLANEEEDKSI